MTEKKPRAPKPRHPDGCAPYRDRGPPPHLGKADLQDGRAHPEAAPQQYGQGPEKGGSQKPPMPATKTQR